MTDYDQAVIEAMARGACSDDLRRPCEGCPDGCAADLAYLQSEGYEGMAQAAWTAAKTALEAEGMRIVYRTAHLGPVVDVTTQEAALTELQRLGQEMEGKLDD